MNLDASPACPCYRADAKRGTVHDMKQPRSYVTCGQLATTCPKRAETSSASSLFYSQRTQILAACPPPALPTSTAPIPSLTTQSSQPGCTPSTSSTTGEPGKFPLNLSTIHTNTATSTRKQNERASKITALPKPYLSPLTPTQRSILTRPIAELVHDVQTKALSPIDVLRAYGNAAVKAHASTNCLT